MILRLLGPQGIAGLAVAIVLAILLGAARIDVRHWKKQSARFEQLYRGEIVATAQTIAAFRTAAERARADDASNAARVARDQSAISQRTAYDLEARLTDARARALGLRRPTAPATTDGRGGGAPLPGLSAAPGSIAQAAGQDRLSRDALSEADALVATEQAIQLDELIKWVRSQASVDVGPER